MYCGYDITSIRILPSDKGTFPRKCDFKEFIEKIMFSRGGYYYFPNKVMRCSKNSLILFQYDGKIRAVGVLIDVQKKSVVDERGVEYSGYYKFDTKTLRYLENPIDKTALKLVYPLFVSFNQSKQNIPIEYLNAILELINTDEEIGVKQIANRIEKEIESFNIFGDSREALVLLTS